MTSPEFNELTVEFLDLPGDNRLVSSWTGASITHHFLEPCRTFSLTLGDERLGEYMKGVLAPGSRVVLRADGAILLAGRLDSIRCEVSKSGGTTMYLDGRDGMAAVCDSCADPFIRMKEGAKLVDILAKHLGPFGFKGFEIDSGADVAAVQGFFSGRRNRAPGASAKRGRRRKRKKGLDAYTQKLLNPVVGEGTFKFLERICRREGLYLWASADSETCIVSSPDVYQEPMYELTLRRDGSSNNVLSSSATWDWKNQASAIFVGGASYSAQFGKSRHQVGIINPLVGIASDGFPTDKVRDLFARHKDVIPLVVQYDEKLTPYLAGSEIAKPEFLIDQDAQTVKQTEFFCRRRLSECMRRAFTYTAEVAGWDQDGITWTPDTFVAVDDELTGTRLNLYILACTYRKSVDGGTTTKLTCVLPESMRWLDRDSEANDYQNADEVPKREPLYSIKLVEIQGDPEYVKLQRDIVNAMVIKDVGDL